jgi:exosortase D (VPLPA-CTERM-specific)
MSVQSASLSKVGVWRPAILLLLIAASIAAFSGALRDLMARWGWYGEEYSHGVLIPAVTAWLLWNRRGALVASFGAPAWAGAALVLVAMAMYITGEFSAIYILAQIGFVIALLGVVLGVGGYSLLRVTLVPILLLLFAIPPPSFIEAVLTLKLQLISSELGTLLIRMFQIPVYLEGNIIDLGDQQLEVAEACSGLRYLFPLLSLGFLLAYFFRAPMWQRGILFLSTIPITILMNSLRIGLVGVTVAYWGPQMADEVLHAFEGWLIFAGCMGMLSAEIYLFARWSGKQFFDMLCLPAVSADFSSLDRPAASRVGPVVLLLLLLGVTGFATHVVSDRSEIVPDHLRFATFPTEIGQWRGHVSLLDRDAEGALHLDDYILSDYVRPDGRAINLYVAYYGSQHDVKTIHPPLLCLPGGGWNIANLAKTKYPGVGGEMVMNRVIIEQNSVRQVVYYWYEEQGRKVAEEYWARWYLFSDAITQNRTDGSLVRVTTPILFGETEADADERLQLFLGDALPSLAQYLPTPASPAIKSVRNDLSNPRL